MPVMVLSETHVDEDEKINVECDDEKKGNSNNTSSDSSPKEGRYISFNFSVIKFFSIIKYKKISRKE